MVLFRLFMNKFRFFLNITALLLRKTVAWTTKNSTVWRHQLRHRPLYLRNLLYIDNVKPSFDY